MLTKSTLNGGGDDGSPRHKFLPNLSSVQQQNGYISDFYKKKQYTSDGSNKLAPPVMQSAAVGSEYPGDGNFPTNGNPANKLNKISSKKFFKSKIDFTAPIKSL